MVAGTTTPVIPTGYEGLQTDIDRRQKLADALQQQSLQVNNNYQSPFQALAQIGQAFAAKHIQNKATDEQTDLNTQRTQAFQDASSGIQADIAAGKPIGEIASKWGSNPMLQNSPLVKGIVDAMSKNLSNAQDFNAPINITDPTGTHAVMFSKAGTQKDLGSGVQLAHDMAVANGQVYDPLNVKPGTVFNDPNGLGMIDPATGKVAINQPMLAAKQAIAASGRSVTNVSTTMNNMDKSFAKVIPEAVTTDLQKSRDAAQSYIQTRPNLDQAAAALNSGVFSGVGAGAKLTAARVGDALGVTGPTTAAKIARTQSYVRNMGQQMLPILAALRPASDTDVKTAQAMTGGDLSLSVGAMKSAVNAARAAGQRAVQQHNTRVKTLQQTFTDPAIQQGLGSFAVPDAPTSTGGTIKRIK